MKSAGWVAALALLPAVPAAGHGVEWALLRLDWLPEGRLRLESTVDFGGNPLLNDAEEARDQLSRLVEMAGADGVWHPWAETADLQWQNLQAWDADAPLGAVSVGGPQSPAQHQLLSVKWEGTAPQGELLLRVRKGSWLDALLWEYQPGVPREDRRWRILVAGDAPTRLHRPQPPMPPAPPQAWWTCQRRRNRQRPRSAPAR